MFIVDAQVHLWSGTVPSTSPSHRQIDSYLPEQALIDMAEAGVDAVIVHPPNWEQSVNGLALEAASRFPDQFAVLGRLALDAPNGQDLVHHLISLPGMLGFRFSFSTPAGRNQWLTDGTADWLWPLAEEKDIPVAMSAGDALDTVAAIAARHPGLRILLDHFGGQNGAKGPARWETLPSVLSLARYPNVAVKATGAPSHSAEAYPFKDIHEPLRRVYDAFGPERMFWGTDITRMPCTWKQCVTLFTEELPWLSANDQELVMGKALCDWLRWHPAGLGS